MNEVTKQSLLDLLAAAKAHIETGEHSEAVEKIEAAIATIENEGVDTTSEEPDDDVPLPGQGSNGVQP